MEKNLQEYVEGIWTIVWLAYEFKVANTGRKRVKSKLWPCKLEAAVSDANRVKVGRCRAQDVIELVADTLLATCKLLYHCQTSPYAATTL